jgi:type II secretory pathway pseudopilin PulG
LVELLVVIAIISLLAGLLLPALENALEQARKTQSMSNLRQIILGLSNYANDYRGQVPPNAIIRETGFKSVSADFIYRSYNSGGYSAKMDLRKVANEYDFNEATAQPSIDSQVWWLPDNHPEADVSSANLISSPYLYFVETSPFLSPIKMSQASSQTALSGDVNWIRYHASFGTRVDGPYLDPVEVRYYLPSHYNAHRGTFYRFGLPLAEEMCGHFAFYDGHVKWFQGPGDLKWWKVNMNSVNYLIPNP